MATQGPPSNPYIRDILFQPAALRDTAAALASPGAPAGLIDLARRVADGRLRRIVLTGMGASCYALHPLMLTLIARGFSAHLMETSELIHYAPTLIDASTLVVAASQSGRSGEIVHLIEIVRGRAPLIGLTNTADSPLMLAADAPLLTRAGDEHSVSCKTYVATLAVGAWLADVLCGGDPGGALDDIGQAADAVEMYLQGWQTHVDTLSETLRDIRDLILVGRGPSLAAAGEGALSIKEASHFGAEAMSSAAFRHGPMEMASPEQFVVIYLGDKRTADLNIRLMNDILAVGGRAALAGAAPLTGALALPEAPGRVYPIVEALPAQMISLALAGLIGHEAGQFERSAKVTTRE